MFIKIETLRGCTPAKIYEMLQEVCLSTISHWSQRFRKARTVLKTSNTLVGQELLHTTHWQPLATLLEEDRCMIYEETARNLEYQIICSHCFN